MTRATLLSAGVIALAFGGSATAASLVTGADVQDSSLTGRDVKARSLGLSDLSLAARNALRGQRGPSGFDGTDGVSIAGPAGAQGASIQGPAGQDGQSIVGADFKPWAGAALPPPARPPTPTREDTIMTTQPIRRRLEPGIYERLGADGQRLGLEVAWKDAAGRARRRSVRGGVQDARDELAKARSRRVRRDPEPTDPRVSFDTVADAFEAAHVAGLRPNSRAVYGDALRRLRRAFGGRRLTSIAKVDVRAYMAAERAEGLKANTIRSHLAVLSVLYAFARDDLDMPVSMPRLKASERPRPADDAREHRVLTDDELAAVLAACEERFALYFRTLAETGARKGEVLGLTRRRVGATTIEFAEQRDRYGDVCPLKTATSRRTIEVTRALAAELALAVDFAHVGHREVDKAWTRALQRARIADPQPVVHDLRHTHVSRMIAAGRDPVEVAQRIGDTLQTTLTVYAHEFDVQRRGAERQRVQEELYGEGMATRTPQQTAADGPSGVADLALRRQTVT
jgi:integrase